MAHVDQCRPLETGLGRGPRDAPTSPIRPAAAPRPRWPRRHAARARRGSHPGFPPADDVAGSGPSATSARGWSPRTPSGGALPPLAPERRRLGRAEASPSAGRSRGGTGVLRHRGLTFVPVASLRHRRGGTRRMRHPALSGGDRSWGRWHLASQSRRHTRTLETNGLLLLLRGGTSLSMASRHRCSSDSGAVASAQSYSFAPPTWRANVDGGASAMG
jgi:hypothetical protein